MNTVILSSLTGAILATAALASAWQGFGDKLSVPIAKLSDVGAVEARVNVLGPHQVQEETAAVGPYLRRVFNIEHVYDVEFEGEWEWSDSGSDIVVSPMGSGGHSAKALIAAEGIDDVEMSVPLQGSVIFGLNQLTIHGYGRGVVTQASDDPEGHGMQASSALMRTYNWAQMVWYDTPGDCWGAPANSGDCQVYTCDAIGLEGCTFEIQTTTGGLQTHQSSCNESGHTVTICEPNTLDVNF